MVKRNKKRFFQGLAVVIAVIAIYYPGYKKVHQARARNARLKEELAALIERNSELEKKLELLQGDMVYIEKRAREKLGAIKEGEIIYEFVPSKSGE